jgi:hypothetical protein
MMKTRGRSESGFSLLETAFSLGILTVGALGLVGVFLQGMRAASSSPGDLTATEKATGAIESVFSARDTHTLSWAQLRNTTNGGIFLTGAKPLRTAGPDGIVNTADDGDVEQVVLPGPDQVLGTRDDKTQTLSTYTREIKISDLDDSLRSITVIITYQSGVTTRSYTLTAYISQFA